MEQLTYKQIQSIAYQLQNRGDKGAITSEYRFIRVHEGQCILNDLGKEKETEIETAFFRLLMYRKHKFPISVIKDIYLFRKKTEIAREHGVSRRTIYRWEQKFIQKFKQEIM